MGNSVFVDNIPPFYDSILLRKLFQRHGRVSNSFIPWKRRIINDTYYGFVNFDKEEDGSNAIKKLDGVTIFGFKLNVKWSFSTIKKKGEAVKSSENIEEGRKDGRSYANVVAQKGKSLKEKIILSTEKKGEASNKQVDSEGEMMEGITTWQWKKLEKDNVLLKTKIEELENNLMGLREEFSKWIEYSQKQDGARSREEGEKKHPAETEKEDDGHSGCRKEDEEISKVAETVFEEYDSISSECTPAVSSKGYADAVFSRRKKTIYAKKNNLMKYNVRRRVMKRRKFFGPCTGKTYEDIQQASSVEKSNNVEGESMGDTVSMGVELGVEGQRIEKLKKDKLAKMVEEAKKTIEVGEQVGVSFNPDKSMAIEKLLAMEKAMEEK